ncbi:MAG: hypothetical protein NZ959_09590 [Armatimonadetes bacterium]|nr:hypothetical protein [Armatimonadota bacterium]MDW8122746.1 uroporphyrinogen decarboxylase family protein [Armatimonadota bacterium]
MTSRERLILSFLCEKTDRVAVSPQTLGRLNLSDPLTELLIKETDPTIYAGDACDVFIGAAVARSVRAEGSKTFVHYQMAGRELVRVIQRTAKTTATVAFPCQTALDVEMVLSSRYDPPADEHLDSACQQFTWWKDVIGEEGLVLWGLPNAVCFPAEWLSPENFCLLWADEPDLIKEMVKVANERLLQFADRLCQRGVDAFRIIGGEYVSVQLGPDAFRQLVVPYDSQLVSLIRSYGAIAYYHIHGPIMRYLPMLKAIGMNAIDPLEAPPWGDADLTYVRAQLGDQICLVGNLDDMMVLDQWSEDQVLELGRRRIEEGGPRGFVLSGTASGTYGRRAAENFIALARMVRETI